MIINLYKKDIAELYNTPIVQQTAFWSVVKKNLGLNTIALNFKSSRRSLYYNISTDYVINSDLLVIIRQINKNDCMAYVPYGPELEPAPELQGSFLEELSESLRLYLPKNCIMIRYDLCWESYWAKEDSFYDCEGNWLGEPPEYSQEIRFNYNTCNKKFRKAYTNILPSNTIFLNLQPDTSVILDGMKPKTRYNIHLSQRKGVYVKRANIESLDIWYKLYKETALRNKIHLNEIKYFEALLTAKADNTKSPAQVQLLIAEQDKVPLASMFLIVSGNRGAYLYGASSNRNRNFMAPYALQWEAIKISKEKGCTQYDMFGVAPNADRSHPLYGLYKFKTGFGGDIYHSLGCWDYPFNEERYFYFRTSEITNQGFHCHS